MLSNMRLELGALQRFEDLVEHVVEHVVEYVVEHVVEHVVECCPTCCRYKRKVKTNFKIES